MGFFRKLGIGFAATAALLLPAEANAQGAATGNSQRPAYTEQDATSGYRNPDYFRGELGRLPIDDPRVQQHAAYLVRAEGLRYNPAHGHWEKDYGTACKPVMSADVYAPPVVSVAPPVSQFYFSSSQAFGRNYASGAFAWTSRPKLPKLQLDEWNAEDAARELFDDWSLNLYPRGRSMYVRGWVDAERGTVHDFLFPKQNANGIEIQLVAVDIIGKVGEEQKGLIFAKKLDKDELERRKKHIESKGGKYIAFESRQFATRDEFKRALESELAPQLRLYLALGAHKPYVDALEDAGERGSVRRRKD